jgi:uncharacterized membrane protein YeaQ/YmgE (transglycosylase-associated protein family)
MTKETLYSVAYDYAMDRIYSYEGGMGFAGGVAGGVAGAVGGAALYSKLNKSREKVKKYDEKVNSTLTPTQKIQFKKLKDLHKDAEEANSVTEVKLISNKFDAQRKAFELSLGKEATKSYAEDLDHMSRLIRGTLRSMMAGAAVGAIGGGYLGSKLGKKLDK